MTPPLRALVVLLARAGADASVREPSPAPAPSTTSTTTPDPCPLLPCAEDVGLPSWGERHGSHTTTTVAPAGASLLEEGSADAPQRFSAASSAGPASDASELLGQYRNEFGLAKQMAGPAGFERADEMLGMLDRVPPKAFTAAAKQWHAAAASKKERGEARRASDAFTRLLKKSANKDARNEYFINPNKIFRGEAAPKESGDRELAERVAGEVREDSAFFATPFWKRIEHIAGIGRLAQQRAAAQIPTKVSFPALDFKGFDLMAKAR